MSAVLLWLIFALILKNEKVYSDTFETQILEARQLFPFRSYKDVQLFHYTVPPQTTFASFQYKANGSYHCTSKTIAVYLQYGSYPVMTLQNATFPEFFVVDRLFLNNIILLSDSVPVMINITNPLPGDWYAAAFLIESTERIAQKGLFTPCISWLSSSLKFHLAEDIIEVLENSEMDQKISSINIYRFFTPKSSWLSKIQLKDCYPERKCLVSILARQVGLPSSSDKASISANCSILDECFLQIIPAPNNWNYFSIENLTKKALNFTLIIETEDCKNPYQRYNTSAGDHESLVKWDNNEIGSDYSENDTTHIYEKTHCWSDIPLVRISLPINLAFEYNLPPEEEDTYPFILNISNSKYTFTSFDVFPIVDIGGTMIIELGISPFMNTSQSNTTVLGCLSYGVRPDSEDCINGKSLTANTSSWESRFAILFVPYPEAGTWFFRMNTVCHSSNYTNDSVGIVPCDSPVTPVFIRIRSTPCVKGNCGRYGNCYQYVSGALIFSTCNCIAGWKGWGCSDNSTALSDGELLMDMLLLTLSNLLFGPLVVLSIYRKYFTEAFVYFATMMSSTFYHACDAEVFSFCLTRLGVLQFCDFYSAILSVWVTLIAMAKLPESLHSLTHMVGAVGVALGVEYDRTGLWVFVIPTGVGLFILFMSWVTQCYKKQICYPAKRIWLIGLIPGALLALSGLIIYAFFETKENYPFVHSAWHVTIALSVLFLLPKRNEKRIKEVENHDTSQPPVAPYVHLLTTTP